MTPALQTMPAVPHDVSAFAAEQSVSAYLPAVIGMTQELFPDASLSLAVEADPEIADNCHIVLVTRIPKPKVSEAVAAVWKWHQGLYACCPATHTCVFRLGLESAP